MNSNWRNTNSQDSSFKKKWDKKKSGDSNYTRNMNGDGKDNINKRDTGNNFNNFNNFNREKILSKWSGNKPEEYRTQDSLNKIQDTSPKKEFRSKWAGDKPVESCTFSDNFNKKTGNASPKKEFLSKWAGDKPVESCTFSDNFNKKTGNASPKKEFLSKWAGDKPVESCEELTNSFNQTSFKRESTIDLELEEKYRGALKKDFRPSTINRSKGKWDINEKAINENKATKKNNRQTVVIDTSGVNTCLSTEKEIYNKYIGEISNDSWQLPVEGYLCFEAYARANWGYDNKTFNKIFPPSEKMPSLFQTIYSTYNNTSKLIEDNRILAFLATSVHIPLEVIDVAHEVFKLENLDTYHFTQKYKIDKYFDMDTPKIIKEMHKNREHLMKINKLKKKQASKKLNKEQISKIKRECVYQFNIAQIKYYLKTYSDEDEVKD